MKNHNDTINLKSAIVKCSYKFFNRDLQLGSRPEYSKFVRWGSECRRQNRIREIEHGRLTSSELIWKLIIHSQSIHTMSIHAFKRVPANNHVLQVDHFWTGAQHNYNFLQFCRSHFYILYLSFRVNPIIFFTRACFDIISTTFSSFSFNKLFIEF